MIPNNNFSVLPWYRAIDEQNARRWWVYGQVYPLYVLAGYIPPFQIMRETSANTTVSLFRIYNYDGSIFGTYTSDFASAITIKRFASLGYDVVIYGGQVPLIQAMPNGRYYCQITLSSGGTWYSDVFTVVNDIEPYLKLEWWDIDDLVMDAGTIVYKYAQDTQFKNVIFLPSDIAKPEYVFEEEGETRDGYFYPSKMISEKRYKFEFFAPEYLLDVLRFVRMSDFVEITYRGKRYSLDTFLMTPEWEDDGDIAKVLAEFETATVAKKLGVGYIKGLRGDFNEDFSIDFNNQVNL